MADDKKITGLAAATLPLAGTEKMEIVQGGVNKQVDVSEVGGGGAVDSVNGATGVVVLDAGDIAFTPAGNIAATNVQAAIEELDSEKLNARITLRTETATYELDATDLANINAGAQLEILLNSASPLSLEIPTNAVQAFPVGTVIGGQQYGAGQVTIAPDVGVTMRSANNANKSFAQYSKFFLEKIGTNEWVLSGDITV